MSSFEPLDKKLTVEAEDSELPGLEQNFEKLKMEGNKNYRDGLYKEALDAYSAAIDISRGTTVFNVLLLTNRASAYIKLHQLEDEFTDYLVKEFGVLGQRKYHEKKLFSLLRI